MDYLKAYYITVVAIFLLGACSDSDAIKDYNTDELVVTSSSTVGLVEGELGQLFVDVESTEEYLIEWKQKSGPLTYYSVDNDNVLSFISPNITKDEEIVFIAQINADNIESKEVTWSIPIENKKFTQQTTKPKPNPFSSPNYIKHDVLPKDSLGVPLYKAGEEYFYYPVFVAQYSYDLYNNYFQTDNLDVLDKFLINATWLRDNCIYTVYGFCSYRSYFALPAYKLTTDWTSAMAQGQAISSLLAAYYLTGNESFAEVANDALTAFLYPIQEKGLTSDFESSLFYEEYGSEEMPAHVLNGFLFALSGVNDFVKTFEDKTAEHIFNVGVSSLNKKLNKYDFIFTSRYDYSPLNQLASTKSGPDGYHEIHIFQLSWLFKVSGSDTIRDFAHLFLKQDMGGIQVGSPVPNLTRRSKEIQGITAKHSLDAVNYGPDRLIDANWTWQKHWSTDRFPAELTLTVNDDINDNGILEKLVISAISKADFPNSLSLYQLNSSGNEELVIDDVSLTNNEFDIYEHEINGYTSYTVTYDLNVPINTNTLVIKFNAPDSGILRIRELDLQYPREKLITEIINRYDNL